VTVVEPSTILASETSTHPTRGCVTRVYRLREFSEVHTGYMILPNSDIPGGSFDITVEFCTGSRRTSTPCSFTTIQVCRVSVLDSAATVLLSESGTCSAPLITFVTCFGKTVSPRRWELVVFIAGCTRWLTQLNKIATMIKNSSTPKITKFAYFWTTRRISMQMQGSTRRFRRGLAAVLLKRVLAKQI
jgi:hypothetical protein